MGPVGNSLLLIVATLASAKESDSRRVLVVVNRNSSDSVSLGAYYAKKRAIPKENVIYIKVGTGPSLPTSEYLSGIETPIRTAVAKNRNPIDFIVLTKGVPIRLDHDGGDSVDSHLVAMDLKPRNEAQRTLNPYFNRREAFVRSKFDMYLVTRLDAYTLDQAKRLVDHSLAAKKETGPFFFDMAGNRSDGDYGVMNQSLKLASEALTVRGFKTILDTSSDFVAPSTPVAGYASWGSNDASYRKETYNRIRFKPGAICETFVSTSGFTFTSRQHWQSLIADLIEQGVTGVKGYVSEPYTFALARPQVLFERYVSGFNLAESFYMASPIVKWKDLVIGDPLCRPYG